MEDQILFCMYYVIQGYWSVTLKGRLLDEGTCNWLWSSFQPFWKMFNILSCVSFKATASSTMYCPIESGFLRNIEGETIRMNTEMSHYCMHHV
jgi:hypothetical protein